MMFHDLLMRQEQQVRCGDRSGGATEVRQALWRWPIAVSALSRNEGRSLTRNRDSRWTCLLLLHFSNAVNHESVQPARRGWEAIEAFSHPAMIQRDTSARLKDVVCCIRAASCGLATSLPWRGGRDRLKDNTNGDNDWKHDHARWAIHGLAGGRLPHDADEHSRRVSALRSSHQRCDARQELCDRYQRDRHYGSGHRRKYLHLFEYG